MYFIKSVHTTVIIQFFFRHELVQDPADFIANYSIQALQQLSSSAISFAALCLIVYGTIKIGLFTALWLKKLWAYPLAAMILVLFVFYQTTRLINSFSFILLWLTAIDIMIIILLRFEYKRASAQFLKA